jgi:hypothetical protein
MFAKSDIPTNPTEAAIANLISETDKQVQRTLSQCEKFDKLYDLLSDWADDWPTSSLDETLSGHSTSTELKEQALVGLVLQGTIEAARVLAEYHPETENPDHRRFYEIARIEWGDKNPGIRLENIGESERFQPAE